MDIPVRYIKIAQLIIIFRDFLLADPDIQYSELFLVINRAGHKSANFSALIF
jgi:hypothetical protein